MGEPENAWQDRLLKAARENHCGDVACETRRTGAAIAVLTGWKEHQDLCWAVEMFQVETGQRDPALVGPEPLNIPSRGEIEAEAFERGRLFAIEGSGTQTVTQPPDTCPECRGYFRHRYGCRFGLAIESESHREPR